MISHGWAPGQFLGAADAPHAEHYTAANASHIRVTLKDDNLGLGAKRGSGVGQGECTGLDVFQNLLGRLNAKDDDELAALEKEQKSREDLKRAIYTEKKWGSVRFVKGGLLVGDKIEKLIEDEAERVKGLQLTEKDLPDKKDNSEEEEVVESAAKEKRSKKSKKDKSTIAETEAENSISSDVQTKSGKKRKAGDAAKNTPETTSAEKSKKKRRRQEDAERQHPSKDTATQESQDKVARKAARKEEKKRQAAAAEAEVEYSASKKDKKEKKWKEKGVISIDLPTPAINTPIPSTPSSQPGTPSSMMSGRHAVRSRNIMQKRMASMDPAALAQIFMIKS